MRGALLSCCLGLLTAPALAQPPPPPPADKPDAPPPPPIPAGDTPPPPIPAGDTPPPPIPAGDTPPPPGDTPPPPGDTPPPPGDTPPPSGDVPPPDGDTPPPPGDDPSPPDTSDPLACGPRPVLPLPPPLPDYKAPGRAFWRDIAVFETNDVRLAPVAFLATQLAPYAGEDSFFQSGDVAERAGFRLRHARFGIDGAYDEKVRLRVTADIGSDSDGELRVHDAWLGYAPIAAFGVYAGAQRTPFSRTAQIPSGQGALIARPLGTRAMAPGHQIGVTATGVVADGLFRYSVGAFNGLQRGLVFYEGYQRNYAPLGNRFDGLSFVARVAIEPLGPLPSPGADEQQGEARLGIGANYLFSDGGSRDIHSAGGDAHLKVSGFHVLTEFLWALSLPESQPTQPDAPSAEVTSLALTAEAGYMILPHELNVALRFDLVDPDTLSDDASDNWLVTAGVGMYLVNQLLRGQIEYTHREEMSAPSLANDVVVLQVQVQLDPTSVKDAANSSAPAAARMLTPVGAM